MYECEYCGKENPDKKIIESCEQNHKDEIAYMEEQTKWGQEFIKEVGVGVYTTALELLEESDNQVEIFETDELGVQEWAIVPIENTEFWLNNLPTKEEAEEFCKEMGWKYD